MPDAPPLAGCRVLVARAAGQAEELSRRIRALGGVPVQAPTIAIAGGDHDELARAIRGVADGEFAAVCFTSPNAVRAVAGVLAELGLDAEAFTHVTVASVGPGTAAVLGERLGRDPDLVPPRATTRSLAEAFPPGSGRVLLPRADIASPVLPETLAAKGYEPVQVVAYRTLAPEALPEGVGDQLASGGIDVVAFTSSSTVRNFAALIGERAWSARVVSIGPVTSQTCAELGIPVTREAERHDLEGLVAAIVRVSGELAQA